MTPPPARRTRSGSPSASTAHASFDAPPGRSTGSEIGPSTASSASRMSAIIAAVTEPEVAGSDPTLLRGRAERDGDEWVIDAHKWFSSGADGAAFAIVMVVTEPEAEPHRRASMILVPTDVPGYELVRRIPVMGHEGRGWGTHCETRFTE